MDKKAEGGQMVARWKGKRKVFTMLCVVTLSAMLFVGKRLSTGVLFHSHAYSYESIEAEIPNTEIPNTLVYPGDFMLTSNSMYPGDFLITPNIRSDALVSTWYGDEDGDVYCNRLAQKVQGQQSRMVVKGVDKAGNIYVGIVLYDITGERKKHGGDVLFVWAESKADESNTQNDRLIAGCVFDHLNGTYTARLKMLWSGTTYIKAKVAAKSGISCLRLRAIEKYGNSLFARKSTHGVHFHFTNGQISEDTRCAPTKLIPGYEAFCNFTMFNFGLSWFCGHPKHHSLNCSDFTKYITSSYDKSKIIPNQPNGEVIDAAITENLRSVVKLTFHSFDSSEKLRLMCSARSALSSWVARYPTGYFSNGHWRENNCLNTVIDKEIVRRCLAGKFVMLIGESTSRQYMEDIGALIDVKHVRFPSNCSVVDRDLNINIQWRKHEMPYLNPEWFKPSDLNSTAHQIRLLADDAYISGSDLIVMIAYNAHLQAFSTSVFRSRIAKAVAAVKYILYKKPGVRVFFKGLHAPFEPNFWFDARVTLMFRDVIFEEFMDVRERVVYLDTLSIAIAHNSVELHPKGRQLRSQTEQFLSYIC